MPDLRLVPPGIDDAVTRAINQLLDRYDALDVAAVLVSLVERQTDLVLEYLAWEHHIDFWDRATTREAKITMIQACYDAHRYKGTRYGMERIFPLLGAQGTISEWFEYGGDPYYFRVSLLWDRVWEDSQRAVILDLIDRLKNTRSWLDRVDVFERAQSAAPVTSGLTVDLAEPFGFRLSLADCYDVVAADVRAADLGSLGLTEDQAEPFGFAVALPTVERLGLDAHPRFDQIPADFAPLDMPLEVTHV
ncbi:hypothetical protein JCM15519_04470 [Fundidesulfovibrio butyratiphilus]